MKRILLVSTAYIDPANRGKPRALAARGLEVTVAVPQRWREPTLGLWLESSWERTQGVEIFPVPVRGAGDPAGAQFRRRAIAALVRDKRPDVVQVEEEPDGLLAARVVKVARAQRVPIVAFTAANTPARGLFARLRRRRALRRAAGVLAASGDAATLARADVGEHPLRVLPQLGAAVPTVPEHLPHDGLVVGYMGRLVARRGLDTLLEALAANRAERWQLIVVGDGPDRERLETLATEWRLAARVRWTGSLPPARIGALWPELDVLVLPSRPEASWREPTAHVLIEAMAHEVAVVGSDSGAIPETIGDAGVVVPAGDPAALAAALSGLADPAVRRPLAQAGRARVMQQYSDDAVAERTIQFWKEILGGQ
jgi:glycosyltransferase involved in cell wall biosynthesis